MSSAQKNIPRPALISMIGAVAIPPLAIDMFLPSLPDIGDEFDASVNLTQWALTLFLIMLGAGQLIAGPLSDSLGRRKMLLTGVGLFVVGSLVAALAPVLAILLIARVIQGAGGAVAVVVANSSVRDFASGTEATRTYSLLMGISAVAPVIAPIIGGWLDTLWDWRAVFWVLTALGIGLFAMVFFGFDEPLSHQHRSELAIGSAFRGYAALTRNPAFVVPAIALVLLFGLLFSYIGGSSYVYQHHFGLSSAQYGNAFGLTGITLMLAPLLVNQFSKIILPGRIGLFGHLLTVVGAVGALIAVASEARFVPFIILMVIAVFGLGLAEPHLIGTAMSATTRSAGQAAALLGAAQFLLGAVASTLAGATAEAGALPWLTLLSATALASLVVAVIAAGLAHRLRRH